MKPGNADNYCDRLVEALEANKFRTKLAYKHFRFFWLDFAHGCRDFEEYPSPETMAAYKAKLLAAWEGA